MKRSILLSLAMCLIATLLFEQRCDLMAKDIQRPEKIVSKRQIIYDTETYAKLADLWKQYNKEFPSEDAYANWMYAARYADDKDYERLLEKGLKKYPANPTLLYLKAMTTCGTHNDTEAQVLLERAVQLDPSYMDPWFGLVGIYMDRNDDERTDVALRRLLESGVITEEIMDYNYNILLGLAKNAILITNGDNDTYPGWILTRILKHRPDVTIVNRSLLNTDWYPMYLIDGGLPKFITKSALEELRENVMAEIRTKNLPVPAGGPFGDTLIVRLIESAETAGRPVYFSWTLYQTPVIDHYMNAGRPLALATLVTAPTESYAAELARTMELWLNEFRTGGLDSWRLRFAKTGDASIPIMHNYAYGFLASMDSITTQIPKIRLDMFRWYQKHLAAIVRDKLSDEMVKRWCDIQDVPEIKDWCRSQGHLK